MFGLAQYNGNGALMATTGFMLTPLASALNRVGYSVSRDEDIPSIAPAQPSSEWSEWLTSGYLGDFLGWSGKQLAEVGRDLFPEFSIPEQQRRMKMSEQELKQLMTESLLSEDEAIDIRIREVLGIYLRQGVALINRGALEADVWKKELLGLKGLSAHLEQTEVARVFEESVEQADLQISRQKKENSVRAKGDKLLANLEEIEYLEPYMAARSGPISTPIDVTTLNAGTHPQGFQLIDSHGGGFGLSVSSAGDINKDGYADMIVGAYAENSVRGAAYVVLGQASFVTTPLDVTTLNAGTDPQGFQLIDPHGGQFGISVSDAGDINGDGYADMIVGAYTENSYQGAAYVILGQASFGTTPIDVTTLNAGSDPQGFQLIESNGRYFGSSVSSAGDVNGDGYADMIVGAWAENGNQGAAYVVLGQASFVATPIDVTTLNVGSNPQGFQLIDSHVEGQFGYSVSSAGDVNGDGYADMIVGALGENNDSGATYVILGQASFVATPIDVTSLNAGTNPRGFRLIDSHVDGQFGVSVSDAGDINGDGYADMIVGAYRENSAQGAAYVVLGQASFCTTPIDVTTLNAGSNPRGFRLIDSHEERFGVSVSNAGDVNGDGYADMIVGALGENNDSGAAYIILGQASFGTTPIDVTTLNAYTNPRGFQLIDSHEGSFGLSVSSAGDVNKDGYADMIVGAYAENNYQGAAYLVLGMSTLASTPIPTPTPSNIPLYPSIFNTNQLNGKQGFTLLGVNAHDIMGWSVSYAGDVNADSIDDMIIGAKSANADAGTAYIVFGQAKNSMPAEVSVSKLTGKNGFTIVGLPNDRELGYTASYAGDVNKDGIADVIMGAPYSSVYSHNDQAGKAYVLFGSRNVFPAVYNVSALNGSNGFSVNGEIAGDLLGYSVSTAGDVNGDGIADVLITAPQATANGEIQSGKVYVIFGQRGNFQAVLNVTALGQTQPGFTVYGETEFDKAGQSVAVAGDINADGIADFVIGAPEVLVGNNLTAAGKVYVIFGNHNGFPQTFNVTALNGQNGFSVSGTSSFDNLGAAVNSAGDVNGDGITDLLVGAPHATVGTSTPTTGAAYVIFGHSGTFAANMMPDLLNGDNGCTLIGYASGDQTGASVAGIGDFNVDGVEDILIGAPEASVGNNIQAGKSYLFFGRENYPATFNLASLDGNTGMTIEGGSTGDEAGFSVSSAGDVNADGAPDLLLGAPGLDNNGAGKSHVLLGGISFFSARPLPRILSENSNRETKSISQKMN